MTKGTKVFWSLANGAVWPERRVVAGESEKCVRPWWSAYRYVYVWGSRGRSSGRVMILSRGKTHLQETYGTDRVGMEYLRQRNWLGDSCCVLGVCKGLDEVKTVRRGTWRQMWETMAREYLHDLEICLSSERLRCYKGTDWKITLRFQVWWVGDMEEPGEESGVLETTHFLRWERKRESKEGD